MATLTEQIVKVLSPVVGDFLAKAVVRAALNTRGLAEAEPAELDEVARLVQLSVTRSLGPPAAAAVADKIRRLKP